MPDFAYSSVEDALWSDVFGTLRRMHEQRSCMQYRLAAQRVGLPHSRVPQLSELSRTLGSLTGFELVPVTGAVSGRLFYPPFADGILKVTADVRPVAARFHSTEPDIIHDVIGHAVALADPAFAEIYRWFGRAATCTASGEAMTAIARLFWFTMEVGVVLEKGRPRACGAAILSSVSEMESFVDADLREFRVEDVIARDIDDSDCQPVLFVAGSLTQMMDEVTRFLRTMVDS